MKYILIAILVLFFYLPSHAQKINSVIYKVGSYSVSNPEKSTENLIDDPLRGEVTEHLKQVNEAMENIVFELYFSQEKAIYGLIPNVKHEDFNYKTALILLKGNSTYFKNINEPNTIQQIDNNGELIDLIMPIYDWEITKETKMINNYLCYKAIANLNWENQHSKTTNRQQYTVWFTPEIPLPFGPMGLDGLPGLVLEASQGGRLFLYASNIELNKRSNKKIELSTGSKIMTYEDYTGLILEKVKNTIQNNR